MGRVGALPPVGFEPATLPTSLQEQIQQTLFRIALDEACAKFGEHAMIKARIAKVQTQGVFPGQPITHGISSLAIGQAFHKLEQRDQHQAPRS
jgi:hypothetical protein